MYGSPFGSVNFRSKFVKAPWSIIEHESNYGGIDNGNLSQPWMLGVQLHDAYSEFSIRHFYHHSYNYSEETAHTVRAYQLQVPRTCETFSDEDRQRRQTLALEEYWYLNRAKVSNIMIEARFTTITCHIPIFSLNLLLSLDPSKLSLIAYPDCLPTTAKA